MENNFSLHFYPDGSSYVSIPKEWEDTEQTITFRVNNYESVIHLAQLCDVLIHNRVKAHIVIPCMIDAQADKRFDEFQSSGLMTIARILDTYVDGYNISMSVFHPHNPEVLEAVITGVDIVDNTGFIREVVFGKLFEGVSGVMGSTGLTVLAPDAGAYKWVNKTMDNIGWKGEVLSASKVRTYTEEGGTKLRQQLPTNDFKGKDILIIDDISVYGGTFIGLAKLLREKNVSRLYLAVSHMTVEDPNPELFKLYDKVFTTDSKGYEYYTLDDMGAKCPISNLEIIKLFN